jgi:hypothetical protein
MNLGAGNVPPDHLIKFIFDFNLKPMAHHHGKMQKVHHSWRHMSTK